MSEIDSYIDIRYCRIERERTSSEAVEPDVIRVYDEEGDLIFSFPICLSDDEVKTMLRELNKMYDKGYRCGDADRARKIRKALGCADE